MSMYSVFPVAANFEKVQNRIVKKEIFYEFLIVHITCVSHVFKHHKNNV